MFHPVPTSTKAVLYYFSCVLSRATWSTWSNRALTVFLEKCTDIVNRQVRGKSPADPYGLLKSTTSMIVGQKIYTYLSKFKNGEKCYIYRF